MSFLAADPVVIRKALVAADKVSHLTNFSQAGRGPWNPKKDASEQFDFVILGGKKTTGSFDFSHVQKPTLQNSSTDSLAYFY